VSEELPNIGSLSRQELDHVLRNGERDVRLSHISAIMESDDSSHLDLVLSVLEEETIDTFIISALVKTVGALGDTSQIGVLQQYLKHPDNRVRSNTIEGLELIADDLIFPVIVPMLQDPDNRVKATSIKTLMHFNQDAARSLILKLAASKSDSRRASACYCLGVDNTPWSENILLKMIAREQSPPVLKIQCQIVIQTGSLVSVAWFALQLQQAAGGKTTVYRDCLNAISERHSLDQETIVELRDLAISGKFVLSLNELRGSSGVSDKKVAQASDIHSPASPPDQVTDSDQSQGNNSYELPESSPGVESWEKTGISEIVSDKIVSSIDKNKVKQGLISHGLSSRKKKKKKVVKKPSMWKAIFNFKEGAGYLVPFVLLMIVFGGIGTAYVFRDKSSSSGTKIVRTAGDDIAITCRVRGVNKKKHYLTLGSGSEYFQGRFSEDVDLTNIQFGMVLRVKGEVTGEKHFGAMVLKCSALEIVK